MAGISRNGGMIEHKQILVTMFFLICTISSYGQFEDTRKEGKHYIGIKAGQNYSWIKLDPRVRQNGILGPAFGISYNYMPQYFGGIIIEAQYIKYGWEETFLDTLNSYSRELSYLEFPVLTNFVIGKKNTHLKFQAGVKLAILLDDIENSDMEETALQYYNGLAVDDPFELGMAFGIALSQIFPIGEFQLDARFNMALSNLFDPADELRTLLYAQNQGLTISIYYWLKIK